LLPPGAASVGAVQVHRRVYSSCEHKMWDPVTRSAVDHARERVLCATGTCCFAAFSSVMVQCGQHLHYPGVPRALDKHQQSRLGKHRSLADWAGSNEIFCSLPMIVLREAQRVNAGTAMGWKRTGRSA